MFKIVYLCKYYAEYAKMKTWEKENYIMKISKAKLSTIIRKMVVDENKMKELEKSMILNLLKSLIGWLRMLRDCTIWQFCVVLLRKSLMQWFRLWQNGAEIFL